MILKLKQTPGLYLVGFMASGKTTIGRKLAERIGWRFADIDDDIEAAAGSRISEIFEKQGETEFRKIEAAAIKKRVREVICGCPSVLSVGGGAYAQADNADLLDEHGVTIWLDCPFEVIQRRTAGTSHRPLARDPEHFAQLYEERREAYARAAYRVPIEGDDAEATLAAILQLPLF